MDFSDSIFRTESTFQKVFILGTTNPASTGYQTFQNAPQYLDFSKNLFSYYQQYDADHLKAFDGNIWMYSMNDCRVVNGSCHVQFWVKNDKYMIQEVRFVYLNEKGEVLFHGPHQKPAIIRYQTNGNVDSLEYFVDGKRHRSDKEPAYAEFNNGVLYCSKIYHQNVQVNEPIFHPIQYNELHHKQLIDTLQSGDCFVFENIPEYKQISREMSCFYQLGNQDYEIQFEQEPFLRISSIRFSSSFENKPNYIMYDKNGGVQVGACCIEYEGNPVFHGLFQQFDNGKLVCNKHYEFGLLHNSTGAAIEHCEIDNEEYYIKGKSISVFEFHKDLVPEMIQKLCFTETGYIDFSSPDMYQSFSYDLARMFEQFQYDCISEVVGEHSYRSFAYQINNKYEIVFDFVQKDDMHLVGCRFHKYGKLHREEYPASVKWSNGKVIEIAYCENGQQHRTGNMPASHSTVDDLEIKSYYVHGKLHRTNGPAIEKCTTSGQIVEQMYYIDGVEIPVDAYQKKYCIVNEKVQRMQKRFRQLFEETTVLEHEIQEVIKEDKKNAVLKNIHNTLHSIVDSSSKLQHYLQQDQLNDYIEKKLLFNSQGYYSFQSEEEYKQDSATFYEFLEAFSPAKRQRGLFESQYSSKFSKVCPGGITYHATFNEHHLLSEIKVESMFGVVPKLVLHREGKPALILYHPNGKVSLVEYFYNGNSHRSNNLPAIVHFNVQGEILTQTYVCQYCKKTLSTKHVVQEHYRTCGGVKFLQTNPHMNVLFQTVTKPEYLKCTFKALAKAAMEDKNFDYLKMMEDSQVFDPSWFQM